MFVLAITPEGGETRRQILTKGEVTFGSTNTNDVVIEGGTASRRHARIVIRDLRYIIVDLKSDNGTYVNGRRITSPLVITPDDTILIPRTTIRIVDVAPKRLRPEVQFAADELALIDELARNEEHAQSIYGDYLESKGDLARAEIVRRLGVGGKPSLPMIDLLMQTDVDWRMRVLRPPIEKCAGDACPREWGGLDPTEHADERRCKACGRDVLYSVDVMEAREHDGAVVLDPLCLRWSGDL